MARVDMSGYGDFPGGPMAYLAIHVEATRGQELREALFQDHVAGDVAVAVHLT